MNKKVVVIGAGFAGLSCACFLSKYGFEVTVLEKHSTPGGRARRFERDGFFFDCGPSWYWMPDVFDAFFDKFDKKTSDFYHLERIDPSYRIFWQDDTFWDIPANYLDLQALLEQEERGAANKLDAMMVEAEAKYRIAMQTGVVGMTGLRLRELFQPTILKNIAKFDIFSSVHQYVKRNFKSTKIQKFLEFPVLFLGATADKIPALYTMMNYADIKLGTWHPKGGMYQIVDAMYKIACSQGVDFHFNSSVKTIMTTSNRAQYVLTEGGQKHACDVVVSGVDYHHTEQMMLEQTNRNYNEAYWQKRTFAPSSILYYIGLDKKTDNVQHHNLFFDADFDIFAKALYERPSWSESPLFYLNVPSVSDSLLAPKGKEALFILIPVAPGLEGDNKQQHRHYFDMAIRRIEQRTGQSIKPHILFKKSFGVTDFQKTYNSYKGNAYGLANTLFQTAHFKPKCRNKKIRNLYYTGQLTVPGPGVPPSLISGEIVANLVYKNHV